MLGIPEVDASGEDEKQIVTFRAGKTPRQRNPLKELSNELPAAVPPELVENLRGASNFERQYRVGGVTASMISIC